MIHVKIKTGRNDFQFGRIAFYSGRTDFQFGRNAFGRNAFRAKQGRNSAGSSRTSRFAVICVCNFLIEYRYKWVKIFEQNYRSSCFLSLRKNLHPSKGLGNVFKINFISVFRISVESTKTPVCKQLSRSEYEPMNGCFFHGFNTPSINMLFSEIVRFISPFKQTRSSTRLLRCVTCHYKLICKF